MAALGSPAARAQEAAPQADAADTADGPASGEIVVTATRTANPLSKVPMSVAVMGNSEIQKRGLKDVGDILRQTPGVALNQDDYGSSNISIRGISSNAGAATTGIYIDDVPISVRQVGFSDGTMFPALFDIDRVEILKGPQGTLFGSGSEGGTVRFIQTQPGFDKWSGRARAEVSGMQHGSPSYEAGAAVGGPIIGDRLAFRASGFYRRSGGYINAITGQYTLNGEDVDSSAALGPDKSAGLANARTIEKDTNWSTTTAFRLALSAKPTDTLTITASLNYQYQWYHNNTSAVSPSLSNAGAGVFNTYIYTQLPASTLDNGRRYLTAANMPMLNPAYDKAWTPYVNLNWDVGNLTLIATSSWQIRTHDMWQDTTGGYYWSYGMDDYTVPLPGMKASYNNHDTQRNFVQEVRLSNASDTRLHWQVGLFYSNNDQRSVQREPNNLVYLADSFFFGSITGASGPFGNGNAFLNAFGDYLEPNSVMFAADQAIKEKQYAVFGQADVKITPNLTLTVGARYARNKLNANLYTFGPESNTNAPFGADCDNDGNACVVGQGIWTPTYASGKYVNNENVFTPKFSLSWQADSDNLFYGTISKGYRPGGAQTSLPSSCDPYYAQIGYTTSPNSYKSDKVWNYEVGAKNKLFGGRLSLDTNLYMIKWSDIQTTVTVPVCAYAFVDNAGKATSKGIDLAASVKVTREFSLSTTLGYNQAKFDTATTLYYNGSYLPNTGSPFVLNLAADYQHGFGNRHSVYGHVDWTYGSRPRLSGTNDPQNTAQYIAGNEGAPPYYLTNARIGYRIGDIDLSVFSNNLFNYNRRQDVIYFQLSPLYSTSYLLPRTFGATVTYQF